MKSKKKSEPTGKPTNLKSNPYDNNRDAWKQTRIDFLMNAMIEAENDYRIFETR